MNFFFYLLRLRRYKAKCVKTRCLQEGVGHLQPKFQAEEVVSGEYFFGFCKTRHILLSDSANCTVLRAVVLPQYRRVTNGRTDRRTDRQTDGIAGASTALAMRALRRAVKNAIVCCTWVARRFVAVRCRWSYCWCDHCNAVPDGTDTLLPLHFLVSLVNFVMFVLCQKSSHVVQLRMSRLRDIIMLATIRDIFVT